MSENNRNWQDLVISPPVIGALITSTVAVLLTVVPGLVNNAPSTPTAIPPTQLVVEATQPPATQSSDDTTVAVSTPIPAANTPVPASDTPAPTEAPSANLLLLYDDAAFTIYNQGNRALNVSNLQFRSSNGTWRGSQWGVGLSDNFPVNNCLRMRDTASGERQPPAICGNLLGFQLVGGSALFWLDVPNFDVVLDGTVITTCDATASECEVFVEP